MNAKMGVLLWSISPVYSMDVVATTYHNDKWSY